MNVLSDLTGFADVGDETFASKGFRGLNFAGRIRFLTILLSNEYKLRRFESRLNKTGECYFGPFVGEFGNFLLHVLPFISYLYKKGVSVHYCGLESHEAFLIDEDGKCIVRSFTKVRDFFGEARISGNSVIGLPDDVAESISGFQKAADRSGLPYLDIFSDSNLYWYTFRNWQLKGRQFVFNLSKFYGGERANKVVVFPRKMNVSFTPNNGARVNYEEVADLLSRYFSEVIFVGHPALSEELGSMNSNIRYAVSGDNSSLLRECSTASLIVTQHSGAMHIGGYTNTPVVLIYYGDPPIKGLADSIRFRINFDFQDSSLIFSIDELSSFCKRVFQ